MAQRSPRKRGSGSAGRATAPAGVENPQAREAAADRVLLSGRAGEPRGAAAPAASEPRGAAASGGAAFPAEPAPELSRTERRNMEARAKLKPLAPGERPVSVTVAAIVSALLGITVIVGYASGARVGGGSSVGGAIFLAAIFFAAAAGMWKARYWAVLGFEALLAFQIIIAALSLTVASNWWAALLCTAVIVLGGWLFWKLVRAMARIQMPARRPTP